MTEAFLNSGTTTMRRINFGGLFKWWLSGECFVKLIALLKLQTNLTEIDLSTNFFTKEQTEEILRTLADPHYYSISTIKLGPSPAGKGGADFSCDDSNTHLAFLIA